jgi:hypothetical protein
MNSNQFRIRTMAGDFMPIQADGLSVHESGALLFVNMDANGNPVPSMVVSQHAFQRCEALGPVQQPQQSIQAAVKEAVKRKPKPVAKQPRKP